MEELSPNTIIELTNGKQCRVIEELGRVLLQVSSYKSFLFPFVIPGLL